MKMSLLLIFSILRNQISSIENKDLKLNNLNELMIGKNSLRKLPLAFLAGLTSLKLLDVARNSLG